MSYAFLFKGVAERVVSGEATFFREQDGNQSSAEPGMTIKNNNKQQ